MNIEKISALRSIIPALATRDQDFASSLLDQYSKKGALSDRQWPWVDKLIEKGNAPKPEAKTANVGDMSGLIALFDKAKENHIKHPKIRIDVDGQTIVLAIAGAQSQHVGQINVQSPGAFGERTWYGRVDRDGVFTQSRAEAPASLVSTLALLSHDPARAGAAHGRKTGNCCFCAKELTDARSYTVGYGPICATKWGLPWGE